MRPNRRTLAISSLVFVCLAPLGCSSDTETTPAPAPSESIPSSTAETTHKTTAPAPTNVASQCKASQLSGAITPGEGGSAGHFGVTLTLTNTGAQACTTSGWPGVSFVGDHNGTQLGAPARRDDRTGSPVVVGPGKSASAALLVTNAGNFSPDRCQPVTPDGLRVYPPNDTEALFVPLTRFTACRAPETAVLTVGALHSG